MVTVVVLQPWLTTVKPLKPVDFSGNDLPLLPSSFDITIELEKTVTPDEFLNHSSRLVYLIGTDDQLDAEFTDALASGKIFTFEFLYREGISADPAYLLGTPDGLIWMMVGTPSSIEYVGLDQAAVCFVGKDDDDDDESDEFDFEML